MSPPYPLPEPLDKEIPGYAKVTTSVLPGQPDATYYVQLPPEYDPHRRYPMIVSLHSIGHDPTMQIEWWAGEHKPSGPPGGKAKRGDTDISSSRRTGPSRTRRNMSLRPANMPWCWAASATPAGGLPSTPTASFSTAMRRAAMPPGTSACSHPDLWAGVIPISAEARMPASSTPRTPATCHSTSCWRVGRQPRRPQRPGLDRYLRNGYNTTVVEYLGRGHEHFLDEQLPMFDWMNRCQRSFPLPPGREFKCETMRPATTASGGRKSRTCRPNSVVANWPAPHGAQAVAGAGQGVGNNTLVLTAGNSRATIWLSPEMVDFKARINITVGGRRPSGAPAMIKPSVETIARGPPPPRRPAASVLGESGNAVVTSPSARP